MAIRQGSIDCLCGVYSVLNATELVVGKHKFNQKLNGDISHKRALFEALIGHLSKKNILEYALTVGIDKIDVKGGLLDIAVKSVKKHHQLKMRIKTAFSEQHESLDDFWEKITSHLQHENACAVINLSGRLEHWTCVKEITPDRLVLADSSGVRYLYRHHCTIGTEEKGMYTLWPTMTYLLSLKNGRKWRLNQS